MTSCCSTGRQVARLAGVSPTTASDALKGLADAGILTRRTVGAASLFEVNERHILVAPLRALLARAREADAVVADRLGDLHRTPLGSVILFGSGVRGEAEPRSDIDLLAVVASEPDDVMSLHALSSRGPEPARARSRG